MLTVQCSLTKWAKACAMPNQRVSMVTVFQERRIRQDPQLTISKEMDRSRICIGLLVESESRVPMHSYDVFF